MGAGVVGGGVLGRAAGAFVREDRGAVTGGVARGNVPAGTGWKMSVVLGRSGGIFEPVG